MTSLDDINHQSMIGESDRGGGGRPGYLALHDVPQDDESRQQHLPPVRPRLPFLRVRGRDEPRAPETRRATAAAWYQEGAQLVRLAAVRAACRVSLQFPFFAGALNVSHRRPINLVAERDKD